MVAGRALARLASATSPLRPPHRAHHAAVPAAAEELIFPIGFEPRDLGAAWHLQPLDDGAGARIDLPKLALVALPGGVPQFPIDPGHARDEAVGVDRAKNRARHGIDLVDFARAILSDPERSLRPGEAGIASVGRRRNRRHNAPRGRIDLLNSRFSDLIEEFAVERRSGVRRYVEHPALLTRGRVETAKRIASREPDRLAVVGDAANVVRPRKRAVLPNDFG